MTHYLNELFSHQEGVVIFGAANDYMAENGARAVTGERRLNQNVCQNSMGVMTLFYHPYLLTA